MKAMSLTKHAKSHKDTENTKSYKEQKPSVIFVASCENKDEF
jgi:hypothetical protein